ncbi:MAG: hypothetical protein K8R64_04090 [Methanosarcinaceae archaeon]|nr:hypothetical protein [Methanosarcinaceae archaeon]
MNTFRDLCNDRSAWIDFVLSKTALIIASVILISASYQLAQDLGGQHMEQELDVIALGLKYAIDDVGSLSYTGNEGHTYTFDRVDLGWEQPIKAYVSSEYVRIEALHQERPIHSVVPMTFRMLPFNESTLRNLLSINFAGQNGSMQEPLNSDCDQVMGTLAQTGSWEILLNTSKTVCMKKTPIYIQNNSEVSSLDLILVYQ